MVDVRALLNNVVEEYPETAQYLSSTVPVVYSPGFESGTLKLLYHQISGLTED